MVASAMMLLGFTPFSMRPYISKKSSNEEETQFHAVFFSRRFRVVYDRPAPKEKVGAFKAGVLKGDFAACKNGV